MRICYLGPAESVHIKKWTKAFAARGHEVHLFSMGKGVEIEGVVTHPFDLHQKIPQQLKSSPVKGAVKRSVFREPVLYIHYFKEVYPRVKEVIQKIKPDVVHAHNPLTYGLFGAMTGFHPLVVSPWGSDVLLVPEKSWMARKILPYVFKRSDLVFSIASHMSERLISLGADPDKIRISTWGVDTERFHPNENERLPQKGCRIVSTRSLMPVYNIETLIGAISLLAKRGFEVSATIVGSGEEWEKLQSLSKKMNLGDKVSFPGTVSFQEILDTLKESEIYVSASLSDGTSQSLLEAMACGLFPIVSDIPANREWIESGVNGFLFPPKDAKTLAFLIEKTHNDSGLMERAGSINSEIIGERADWSKNVDAALAEYRRLIG